MLMESNFSPILSSWGQKDHLYTVLLMCTTLSSIHKTSAPTPMNLQSVWSQPGIVGQVSHQQWIASQDKEVKTRSRVGIPAQMGRTIPGPKGAWVLHGHLQFSGPPLRTATHMDPAIWRGQSRWGGCVGKQNGPSDYQAMEEHCCLHRPWGNWLATVRTGLLTFWFVRAPLLFFWFLKDGGPQPWGLDVALLVSLSGPWTSLQPHTHTPKTTPLTGIACSVLAWLECGPDNASFSWMNRCVGVGVN